MASVLLPFGVSPASVAGTCDARTVTNEARSVTWHISAREDLAELDRWCRAVGPPIVVPSPSDQIFEAAQLSDLVVLTWNAHLFEGDLRRLIRQYGRTQDNVFPVGTFFKGGNYGTDVNFPVHVDEQNNPEFTGCADRNA